MGLFEQLQAYIDANTPRNTRKPVNAGTVIDQGLLGGRIGQVPQRAQDMYQGLLKAPAELAALGSPAMRSQVDQAMTKPQPADKQQWMDAGMELSGMAPVGGLVAHTVYHGSPHKFDKFDMGKIGTGEGAQAYGHGLYFAESPDVAKDYMRLGHLRLGNPTVKGEDIFSASNRLAVEGKPDLGDTLRDFHSFLNEADNSSKVISRKADKQAMLEQFKARTQQEAQHAGDQYAGFYADRLKNIDFLEQNLDPLPASSFYKVDIPDEAIPRMLDWDKPLSEQAELVKMVQEVRPGYYSGGLPNASAPIGGSDAYLSLVETLGKQGATDFLKAKGYPGIRYLDGTSRTAGQGTSNFVLFDDQMPRILEINGQPTGLLSWADESKKAKKK